jgi:hypothetical protein
MFMFLFAREVGSGILVLHFRGDIGTHASQRLGRLLVAAIRGAPQSEANRLLIVGQRQSDLCEARGEGTRVAADWVCVVELIVANTHFDRGEALAVLVAAIDGSD